MSTNDERAKDAEALAALDWSQGRADPVKLAAARVHLAARLDSLAGEVAELRRQRDGWMAHNRESTARAEAAEAELHKTRCERDEARACIETSAETITSLRAEVARLREALSNIHRIVQRDVHDEDAESIERMCMAHLHDSDCATHNEPAHSSGPCDCRLAAQSQGAGS